MMTAEIDCMQSSYVWNRLIDEVLGRAAAARLRRWMGRSAFFAVLRHRAPRDRIPSPDKISASLLSLQGFPDSPGISFLDLGANGGRGHLGAVRRFDVTG